MPGDVLGTNLFNFQTNGFTLTKGPIFTELLLADEINRTPPKTQAALLQAMQERARHHRRQGPPARRRFMVVATQNPIEQQGTYPLPEAQLDRFLFKHHHRPIRAATRSATSSPRHGHRSAMPRLEDFGLQPVVDAGDLGERARGRHRASRCRDELIDYIVDAGPRDPRACLARGRRLAARRQHAGRGGARLRGAARAATS